MPIKSRFRILFAFVANLTLAATARADEIEQVGPAIAAAAFEPSTFFSADPDRDRSVLRIVHLDQYGRPIYSIAIHEGCFVNKGWSEQCGNRLVARMVRAPAPFKNADLRNRSIDLAKRLVRRNATTHKTIRSALPSLDLEWMEADLHTCPGFDEQLASAANLAWLPLTLTPDREQLIWVDTDSVEVAFDYYPTTSTFSGVPIEGSPGEWAVNLARTLDGCSRPSKALPPWSR